MQSAKILIEVGEYEVSNSIFAYFSPPAIKSHIPNVALSLLVWQAVSISQI